MTHRQKKMERIVIPIACGILGSVLLLIALYPICRMGLGKLYQAIDQGARQYQVNGEYLTAESRSSILSEGETEEMMIGSEYARLIQQDIVLDAPIFYGDSEECLQKGLGQYANQVAPGKPGVLLLSGHDSTYLRDIDELTVGQFITIIVDQKKFYYRITKTAISGAEDLDSYLFDTEEEELVLYTCYPIGDITSNRNQRYIVYGKRYLK